MKGTFEIRGKVLRSTQEVLMTQRGVTEPESLEKNVAALANYIGWM